MKKSFFIFLIIIFDFQNSYGFDLIYTINQHRKSVIVFTASTAFSIYSFFKVREAEDQLKKLEQSIPALEEAIEKAHERAENLEQYYRKFDSPTRTTFVNVDYQKLYNNKSIVKDENIARQLCYLNDNSKKWFDRGFISFMISFIIAGFKYQDFQQAKLENNG